MSNNFLEFFGFEEDPFKITPDIDFYFNSKYHQEALMALEYIYHSEEGFVVIVGEPGTGKTITIRKFLSQIPDNMEYAYILFPNLSPEELLYAILEDFGVQIPKEENTTKNKLFSILKDFLINKKKEGKKLFIIVDEAQNLPIETLEELRILSNLETEKEKLLQIILIGQPELEEKLNSPKLRQLKQRITVFVKLSNLSKDETESYINYRLSKAGGSSVRITKKAINEVYKLSKGIPRLINQIMERALMAAFVNREYIIDTKHIKKAKESLKNLESNKKNSKMKNFIKLLIFLAIIIILFIGVYFYITNFSKNKENNSQKDITQNKKETTKNLNKKYYVLYFATTPSLGEAIKIKKKYEELSGKKMYILKLKNGKLYAVARLYEDKEKGQKEQNILKNILNDEDAFLTANKISVNILN